MTEVATFQLDMTRFIRAPRDKVFDAFTNEDALAAWHCARGMRVGEASADARVGGRYRISMVTRDGTIHTVNGEYQAIERPAFLAYTWVWESTTVRTTLIEVTLTEQDGGTLLHMRHTGFPDASTRDSHQSGWQSVFNRLADYLDPQGTAGSLRLVGDARTSYCCGVRMALAEKGVAYTLEPPAPHSTGIDAVHPFGLFPVLRDGPLELYEMRAILGYIDEAFDGPSLQPNGGVPSRARGEQWISVINRYGYDAMMRRYTLQYVFPSGEHGQPDRTVIDAAVPEVNHLLAVFEQAYGERDYLVGSAPSMADFMLAPMLFYLNKFPEGSALLSQYPNVQRARAVMQARPSFIATQPT